MKNNQLKFYAYVLFVLSSCISLTGFSQDTKTKLTYTLSMPNPHTHYFDVKMDLTDVKSYAKNGKITIKMATWTPGSYLIREYARHVPTLDAMANGKPVSAVKVNKNTWEINSGQADNVSISYSVYAYELTVRTSYLDDTHGYINGASVFMYVPDLMKQAAKLVVQPFEKFSKISTALKSTGKNTFAIENFDQLVDSPIEIGNQEILTFDAQGVKHTIAMYSHEPLVYDKAMVLESYKKVVDAATSVVGEHPCKEYLFIVHHLPGIGGGLEHLFSTTCQTSPAAYSSAGAFRGFMGLIAHEYFHLWNVKRIRPEALGPFDYENENYTHLLWVSEGFTSFYQDELLRRAGMMTEDQYLNYMANDITGIENLPGEEIQSAAESSWDAWIKYYRRDENSDNTTVSYYSKGGVIGMLLNIEILAATNGQKSLDDVMKYLYNEYYKKKGRGFTDAEMQLACEKIAGKSLNDFYLNYVWGTTQIDYPYFFDKAGLMVKETNAEGNEPYFGANVRGNRVTTVSRGSGAYENGIYTGDEIVSVDGEKYASPTQFINNKKVGDLVKVTVKRSGTEFTYDIPLKRNPAKRYSLSKMGNMSAAQKKVYSKMMHL